MTRMCERERCVRDKKGGMQSSGSVELLKHDITVVGGGPAGLLAGAEAARNGCDVVLLEEHSRIGEPDHCAGLLSITGLRSLGLKLPARVVQNHVNGARIWSPCGHSIEIRRGRREACVVDRRLFDSWLADLALNAGVEVITNTAVRGVIRSGGQVAGVTCDGRERRLEYYSRITINAEGVRGVISKLARLGTVPRRNKYPAYQYEMGGLDIQEDVVEMFYSKRFAPGFFAWIIPLGDGRARVGLAANSHARSRLRAAISHHPVMHWRLMGGRIERTLGGTVIVGMPIRPAYGRGMMLVGDAAGHVKPTTGGGVVLGGIGAIIAGRVASRAVQAEDTSVLSEYDAEWKRTILGNIRAMYFAQKAISALSDRGVDILIREARRLGLEEIVVRKGDMDRQEHVITALLRDPRALLLLLRIVRYVTL